jgi:hypothetical protein
MADIFIRDTLDGYKVVGVVLEAESDDTYVVGFGAHYGPDGYFISFSKHTCIRAEVRLIGDAVETTVAEAEAK